MSQNRIEQLRTKMLNVGGAWFMKCGALDMVRRQAETLIGAAAFARARGGFLREPAGLNIGLQASQNLSPILKIFTDASSPFHCERRSIPNLTGLSTEARRDAEVESDSAARLCNERFAIISKKFTSAIVTQIKLIAENMPILSPGQLNEYIGANNPFGIDLSGPWPSEKAQEGLYEYIKILLESLDQATGKPYLLDGQGYTRDVKVPTDLKSDVAKHYLSALLDGKSIQVVTRRRDGNNLWDELVEYKRSRNSGRTGAMPPTLKELFQLRKFGRNFNPVTLPNILSFNAETVQLPTIAEIANECAQTIPNNVNVTKLKEEFANAGMIKVKTNEFRQQDVASVQSTNSRAIIKVLGECCSLAPAEQTKRFMILVRVGNYPTLSFGRTGELVEKEWMPFYVSSGNNSLVENRGNVYPFFGYARVLCGVRPDPRWHKYYTFVNSTLFPNIRNAPEVFPPSLGRLPSAIGEATNLPQIEAGQLLVDKFRRSRKREAPSNESSDSSKKIRTSFRLKKMKRKSTKKKSRSRKKEIIIICDYTEKSIVVVGDTYKHRAIFKNLGGKWNTRLRVGKGWVFPKNKQSIIKKAVDSLRSGKKNVKKSMTIGRRQK